MVKFMKILYVMPENVFVLYVTKHLSFQVHLIVTVKSKTVRHIKIYAIWSTDSHNLLMVYSTKIET